ncbi:MAG TPA: EpsI family protein [Vicinamibacterales bacterium]|jgi:EpsI family protein
MTARVVILAAVLAAGGLGREAAFKRVPIDGPPISLARIPSHFETWQSAGDSRYSPAVERTLATDAYLNRAYRDDAGRMADLYIGYYRVQRQGASIHSPLNCLPGAGWEPVRRDRVPLDEGAAGAIVNRVVVQKGEQQQLVYYWYQSFNRIVASDYASKFYLVADAITKRRGDAALVRVVVSLPSGWPDVSADRSARALADRVSRSVAEEVF